MKSVKFGHAISFFMLRKVFLTFFLKKILGLSKAIGFFSSPTLGNFGVPSTSLEVLDLALAVPPRLYHVTYYLLGDEKYLILEGIGLGPCYE